MGLISIAKFTWTNPGNRGRRLARLARAVEWQLYKRTIRKPRVIKLPNGLLFKAYPDCVISSALQYSEWPEYHEIHFCRKNLKQGDAVIDVGANVGHFSLLLGDIVGGERLHCFEPTPISFRRLAENFELNGWPKSNLHQCALGRDKGSLKFPDTKTPLTTNSFRAAAGAHKTIQISVDTLDHFCGELGPGSVGLLKIDVEGFESEVLRGSQKFLQRTHPRLIMFEFLRDTDAPDARELLRSAGYEVFQLNPQGHPHQPPELRSQNLFAVPSRAIPFSFRA